MKPSTALLALITAMFVVAGAFLIAVGDGEDRLVGAAAILFFGVGGALTVAAHLTRPRPGAVRQELITHRGRRVPAEIFPVSRRHGRLAAASAVAAALGLLGFGVADGRRVLLVGAGLAAALAAVLVAALRDPGYVALTDEGLLTRSRLGGFFVPWDAVEDVGVLDLYGTEAVALVVDRSRVEGPRLLRAPQSLNRRNAGVDLMLPIVAAGNERLLAAIDARVTVEDAAAAP